MSANDVPIYLIFTYGGLVLFGLGGLARFRLRKILAEEGQRQNSIMSISSEFRSYKIYAQFAQLHKVAWWPLVCTLVGILGGMATGFIAIVLHNQHRLHS